MKKILLPLLGCFVILYGCNSNELKQIDSEKWINENGEDINMTYSQQISNADFLSDLNYFSSENNILDNGQFLISNIEANVKFDNKSTVNGGGFIKDEKTKSYNGDENSEIQFGIDIKSDSNDSAPFNITGSLSLLYTNDKAYAQVHSFIVDMGEGNINAKMFTLLGDLVKDKWVDLEAGEGSFIQLVDNENDLSYLGTMLLMPDIVEDINFTTALSYVLGFVSNYLDLGFNTEGLTLTKSNAITFGEFGDGTIQKSFTGTLSSENVKFDLSMNVSKLGFNIKLFNIFIADEDSQLIENESEYYFSLNSSKKGYMIDSETTKDSQKIADIEGIIKINKLADFDINFKLTPLELNDNEIISGKLIGKYEQNIQQNGIIPQLSGELLSLTEMINSLN